MILPGSYLVTVLLLVLSLLGWSLWAGTFKLAGKWRYELYYFDFAIGMAIASFVAALTFGSMGWDGFSFLDDVRNAGKRQDLFAFLSGGVFNLGNVLVLASISISGMSVGLPIGLGVALVAGAIWNWFTHPGGNVVFVSAGCAALVIGVGLVAFGYKGYVAAIRKQQAASTGKTKVRRQSAVKAVLLAAGGGLLLGSFAPLVELAADSESGLGPYSIVFLLSGGVVATTFVYSLFLMNLPVQGQAVDFGEYFKGAIRQHLLGISGGAVLAVGLLAALVVDRAEGQAHVTSAVSYMIQHSAPLLGALLGIFVFKEFADGDGRFKTFLFLAMVLLAAGITLVGFSSQIGAA